MGRDDDMQHLPARASRAVPDFGPRGETYLLLGEGGSSSPSASGVRSLLRRQRWTILAGTIVVVVASLVFTLLRPNVYQASSTFLVLAPGGDNGPALQVLERMGQSGTIETETELLQSRRVVEPVVRDLAMHVSVESGDEGVRPGAVFTDFRAGSDAEPGTYRIAPDDGGVVVREAESGREVARGAAGSELSFAGLALTLPPDADDREYTVHVSSFLGAVQGAMGRISATALDRDASLLELTCRGGSARAAYELCTGVSQSYLSLRSDLQRAEATAAADFLTEQLEEVGAKLSAAEDSLSDYQERNLAVALDARASSEVQQSATLQSQRDQLEAERTALAGLINQIEGRNQGARAYRDLASFPTFLRTGNPVIGDLLQSLVELENQRAELGKTRTERNPDIVAVDSRINEIENQLRSIATNYEQALGSQISSLDRMVGRSSGRISSIPGRQIATVRLSRQVELLDNLYRTIQTRLREADMARSISLPSVRIVDEATMPLGPTGKNLPLNMALGLLLGLGFGLLLAVYRERADTRLRGRLAIESGTGVPVLAMFPQVRHAGPILPVSRPHGNGSGGALVGRPSQDLDMAREAFWGLVTDLQFAARGLKNGGLRSLAITSSTRGEGKTFSACNLAIAESSASVRTLLIDADLRGRGVSRFFQLASHVPGLAEVLAGTAEADEAWQPLTVDGRGELYVLPSGSADGDRRMFMETDRLDDFMAKVESMFDLVVIDTPPLNILSDTAAIAASVDGVMVVVRAGLTDREALDLTLDRLKRANAEVMGIVLNDVDLPHYYTSYSHAPDA